MSRSSEVDYYRRIIMADKRDRPKEPEKPAPRPPSQPAPTPQPQDEPLPPGVPVGPGKKP